MGPCSSSGETITLGVDGFMKSLENASEKKLFDVADEVVGDKLGSGVSGVLSESYLGNGFIAGRASESSKNDRPTELGQNACESHGIERIRVAIRYDGNGVSGMNGPRLLCSKIVLNVGGASLFVFRADATLLALDDFVSLNDVVATTLAMAGNGFSGFVVGLVNVCKRTCCDFVLILSADSLMEAMDWVVARTSVGRMR